MLANTDASAEPGMSGHNPQCWQCVAHLVCSLVRPTHTLSADIAAQARPARARPTRIRNAYYLFPAHCVNTCAEFIHCSPTLTRRQDLCIPSEPDSRMLALCCPPSCYCVNLYAKLTQCWPTIMHEQSRRMPGEPDSRIHTLCCSPNVLPCAHSSYNVGRHCCASDSHACQASKGPECIQCVSHLLC